MENPMQQNVAQAIGEVDNTLVKSDNLSESIELTNAGDSLARKTLREMAVTAAPGAIIPSLSAMEDARTSLRATEIAVESAYNVHAAMVDEGLDKTEDVLDILKDLISESSATVKKADAKLLSALGPDFDQDAMDKINQSIAKLIGPSEYGDNPTNRFKGCAEAILELINCQGISVDAYFTNASIKESLAEFENFEIRKPDCLSYDNRIAGLAINTFKELGPCVFEWVCVENTDQAMRDVLLAKNFGSLHGYYEKPRKVDMSNILGTPIVEYYNAIGELNHYNYLEKIVDALDDLKEQTKVLLSVCDKISDDIEEKQEDNEYSIAVGKGASAHMRQIILFATNTRAICLFSDGFCQAIEAVAQMLKPD